MQTRRVFPLTLAAGMTSWAGPGGINLAELKKAQPRAESTPAEGLRIDRTWSGDLCRVRLSNQGRFPIRVREVVLAEIRHSLPADTELYGESFQMLSQTGGTLSHPRDLGYSETKHYRIPQPADVDRALTGMLLLAPPGDVQTLLAFTSCHRFVGRFYLRPGSITIVMDAENLELSPGEACELEELLVLQGADRAGLLTTLGRNIQRQHPPLLVQRPPTGWCSWYCFGPRVTAQNVLDNLDAIAKDFSGLRYVQIDDGYQPAMGDWLEPGKAFGGDLTGVLREIRKRGFEPAIWVAPFIAEAGSNLFRNHPDWFVQDESGKPMPSDRVTFGGWRRGPWYSLDGTHPDVQMHLENLFRTMRKDWGCTYFKLDANFWGAIHGGVFNDHRATRIEAYRRGMHAILEGAGDSFILGCNHPIWGSFGLIHGSRNSGDISRNWKTISGIAREGLSRNWQNGMLWWNDPDAVVLHGDLPENEFLFHATAIYASGGMILSGDDLTRMPAERAEMLRKLLPPTGIAARFANASLDIGVIDAGTRTRIAVFNWDDTPRSFTVPLRLASRISDFWTGAELGEHSSTYTVTDLAPRSARLLDCVPIAYKGSKRAVK